MTYQSIEDVPERDVERSMDYMGAVSKLAPSRTAMRVAMDIAEESLLKGESRLTHKELERRTGVCRRTLQRAIFQLRSHGLIDRTGTTDEGTAVYVSVWERGEEYRRWGNEFNSAWEGARKARQLKHFTAPSYPLPASGLAHGEA
ncbi:hypothetical protein [Mesorhizobium sp. DCY119]|uniref:hypothetical protein n=1 Tax=Mesorhizobium sp. DCY119 TaxID=2108445 RepID=UPI000E6D146F|nr:hypothetical protein [Mesorhizobium sp. DCY119]RJG44925.1 hypothetical protein D3Y55_12035 [Mesorhizobium sp. DCY119]